MIARAAAILRAGGLVAFPTETVYGLGADATNAEAVTRIFAVKGRPLGHPLIVHIGDVSQLDVWAGSVPVSARALAEEFWPGPLTVIVERGRQVVDAVTGGHPTVGLRVPDHPMALELLREFAGAIAAPSANRFGRVSPTSADHVRSDLGDEVDFVLDGGPCAVGVESTIIDCTSDVAMILRHGAVTADEIAAVIGYRPADVGGPSRAPGMMVSHYAPDCRVVLADSHASAAEVALGLPVAEVLDPGPDVAAFAHDLYRLLRDADRRGVATLVVVLAPEVGIGVAVNERLRKAAGGV